MRFVGHCNEIRVDLIPARRCSSTSEGARGEWVRPFVVFATDERRAHLSTRITYITYGADCDTRAPPPPLRRTA